MTLEDIFRRDDRGTISIVDATAICVDEDKSATGVGDRFTGGNSAAVQVRNGRRRDGLCFGREWQRETGEIGGLIERPVGKVKGEIVSPVIKQSECTVCVIHFSSPMLVPLFLVANRK